MARKIQAIVAKKIGDWNATLNFMGEMGYRVKTVTRAEQYKVCKELKAIVIGHLVNQDLNWEPLSEKTKKIKNQANRDKILIDTELYLSSITLIKEGDFSGVGIKKGKAYRRKGNFATVDRVARMLEFGTTRMKARPLWEPSIEEMGGPKGIRNRVAEAIYNKLKASARNTPIRVTKSNIAKSAK